MRDKSKDKGKYGRLDADIVTLDKMKLSGSDIAIMRKLSDAISQITCRILVVEEKRIRLPPNHPLRDKLAKGIERHIAQLADFEKRMLSLLRGRHGDETGSDSAHRKPRVGVLRFANDVFHVNSDVEADAAYRQWVKDTHGGVPAHYGIALDEWAQLTYPKVLRYHRENSVDAVEILFDISADSKDRQADVVTLSLDAYIVASSDGLATAYNGWVERKFGGYQAIHPLMVERLDQSFPMIVKFNREDGFDHASITLLVANDGEARGMTSTVHA